MQASRQWATRPDDQRFKTLDELFEAVNSRRMRSQEKDTPLVEIEATVVEGTDDITFNHGIKSVRPTHWSFGQIANIIGAPATWLRKIPADLVVKNVNYGIQQAASERGSLKFMTLLDHDGGFNQLQAVTSTTYGRIFDADVVQAARNLVQSTGGKFYNPKAYNRHTGQPEPSGLYASNQDCFIFMIDGGSVFDAGTRAQLNRGFFLQNSEVGAKTLKLMMFLFNTCCGNHIVWNATGIREIILRHTFNGPTRFVDEVLPTLLTYANESEAPIVSKVKKAQDYLLPAITRAEVIEWLQNRKFSKGEAASIFDTAMAEEKECRTLWNVIQGATAFAREFSFADARVDMETRAGKLMELVS